MLKIITLLVVILPILVNAKKTSLVIEKEGFKTKIMIHGNEGREVETPPKDLFDLVKYKSSVGLLPAYISKPKDTKIKNLAIIWLVGGMSNGISSTPCERGSNQFSYYTFQYIINLCQENQD